jgi:5-methylcytosine-specific restriction endonuclease McrA
MCIACGCHQDENIIYLKRKGFRFEKLPVHHVDHDKEQGCNGKPFNLVPLCRKCHMKEGNNQEEYRHYVNKTLQEGFKWGVWSEEEYQRCVMYDE